MNKLFCALLAILAALTFSDCGKKTEMPRIPFIMIDHDLITDLPEDAGHSILFYTDTGEVYEVRTTGTAYESNRNWVNFDSEDWYEHALSLIEDREPVKTAPENQWKPILENYDKFSGWAKYDMQDYRYQIDCYWDYELYGVYEKNGKMQAVNIAEISYAPKCLDCKGARKFASSMFERSKYFFNEKE